MRASGRNSHTPLRFMRERVAQPRFDGTANVLSWPATQ
jgi:hypothetical protein